MLRPYEDEFWFSLSDSDIALFLQGINYDGRYDVDIREIDVEEKNKIDEQNDQNRFRNLFFSVKNQPKSSRNVSSFKILILN